MQAVTSMLQLLQLSVLLVLKTLLLLVLLLLLYVVPAPFCSRNRADTSPFLSTHRLLVLMLRKKMASYVVPALHCSHTAIQSITLPLYLQGEPEAECSTCYFAVRPPFPHFVVTTTLTYHPPSPSLAD